MNKKIILLMILVATSLQSSDKKYVFSAVGAGFFSNFFGALNRLWWCEQVNRIPVIYWDQHTLYWQPEGYKGTYNAWEYYFEPVSELSYEPGDSIDHGYWPPQAPTIDFAHFADDKNGRRFAKQYVDRYIQIKPYILKQVEEFYQKYMNGKRTIGIYVRGTDKHVEVTPVPLSMIVEVAQQFAGCQFFVATDEESILEFLKKSLPGPVIHTNCYRSQTGKAIHFSSPCKAKAGEEVLIDALLLARCNEFMHTISNVSKAVLVFNPELDNICLAI